MPCQASRPLWWIVDRTVRMQFDQRPNELHQALMAHRAAQISRLRFDGSDTTAWAIPLTAYFM
jgi:hypothetical protein